MLAIKLRLAAIIKKRGRTTTSSIVGVVVVFFFLWCVTSLIFQKKKDYYGTALFKIPSISASFSMSSNHILREYNRFGDIWEKERKPVFPV